MGYKGTLGNELNPIQLNWVRASNVEVYVVSGSTKWGHALLGTSSGWFHITDPGLTYPRWIETHLLFKKYLEEDDKYVLGVLEIPDSTFDPDKLRAEIVASLRRRWFWGGFVHNCVNYVEYVLQKAGSDFKMEGTNFPVNGLQKAGLMSLNGVIGNFKRRTKDEAMQAKERLLK